MSSISRRAFMSIGSATVLSAAAATGAPKPTIDVSASGSRGEFRVGAATRDITPPTGQEMWGYSNPQQIAEGVRDPLMARCVAFRSGRTAVGIAVIDYGRMPTPASCEHIRRRCRSSGFDAVVFMATHTHSGPYMELDGLPHLKLVEDGIIDGLREAHTNAKPAKIGLERERIDISFNRRRIKDGECYMQWRNENREPTFPNDQEAGVFHVVNADDDTPIVTLVNYACHPVIFGPDNREYSADWPGEMSRLVSQSTGAPCIFLQAAAGDINPYLDKTPVREGGSQAVDTEGRKAADAVLAAIGRAAPRVPEAPSIHYRQEPIEVGTRWDLSDAGQVRILQENYGRMYEKYMKGIGADLAVPLGILILNGDMAFSFMPGEMFVDFQHDLKKRSPIRDTFLCGYANEFHVYFPTVRDIAYGGYGAATVTYVGVGAGERLVTAATRMIGEMTNKIGPLTGPEDFEIKEL